MNKFFKMVMTLSAIPISAFAMQSSQIVRIASNVFAPTARVLCSNNSSVENEILTTEQLLELETLGKFPSFNTFQKIEKSQPRELMVLPERVNAIVKQAQSQNSSIAIIADFESAQREKNGTSKEVVKNQDSYNVLASAARVLFSKNSFVENENLTTEQLLELETLGNFPSFNALQKIFNPLQKIEKSQPSELMALPVSVNSIEKQQDSYFAKGKAFISSRKKALFAAVFSGIVVGSKYAYDHANISDNTSIKHDDFTEQEVADVVSTIPATEVVAPEVEPVSFSVEPEVVAQTVPFGVESDVDTILEKPATQEVVQPLSQGFLKKIGAFDIKNYSVDISDYLAGASKITTKKTALAAASLVGFSAILYQLLSMYSKPSFDDLVKQYIYETQEQEHSVIVEQFIQALEKYGYTSVQDKQKAIQILIQTGLIQA